MTHDKLRRVLLLTDDNFMAEVLGTYLRSDAIELHRVFSADEAAREIVNGADGVVVDLSKRGVTGDAIVMVSNRAQRWKIPMMILSAQSRRDLTDFVELVQATDVISKKDPMTAIASRLRFCMRTPVRTQPPRTTQVGWAVA